MRHKGLFLYYNPFCDPSGVDTFERSTIETFTGLQLMVANDPATAVKTLPHKGELFLWFGGDITKYNQDHKWREQNLFDPEHDVTVVAEMPFKAIEDMGLGSMIAHDGAQLAVNERMWSYVSERTGVAYPAHDPFEKNPIRIFNADTDRAVLQKIETRGWAEALTTKYNGTKIYS